MLKNFTISIFIFFGICVFYFFIMISKTEDHFTYLLDDAYIHLALAKNYAFHDIWGITKYVFSSSSSSPIFTYLISLLMKVFGNSELIPFCINVFCMVGVIYFLTRYYSRFSNMTNFVTLSVLITVFSSVLHLQVFSGMEHVLQVLLVVINIFFLTDWASSNFKKTNSLLFFYGSILLLGLVRFEMMFYIVSLAFFLALLKKFREAFLVLLFGLAPIIIFCYFNYQQTGYFFPNSVVVKGAHINFEGNVIKQIGDVLLTAFLNRSFYKRCLLPLLLLGVIIIIDYRNKKSLKEFYKNNFLLFAWAATMLLHSVFADLKSILRYEAYLIVAFAMLIIPRLSNYFIHFKSTYKTKLILTFLLAGNLILLFSKMVFAHKILMYGSKNIYEQQIQSAKFLHTYYNDSKIAANDIGAISYFTDIHLFDIVGLGSPEIIKFNESTDNSGREFEKFIGTYTKEKKFQIAVVYKEWLRGNVPENWEEVAVLAIDNNAVVSQTNVTVYCINPEIKETLKNNIRKFNWNENVKVTITE